MSKTSFYCTLLLLTLSGNAFSKNLPKLSEIPDQLDCSMNTTNPTLQNRTIKIRHIRTNVELEGLDAHLGEAAEIGWFTTVMGATNECDNDYNMAFATDDLVSLEKGEIKSITGIIKYMNADQECMGFGCNLRPTETIICHK